jgi:glycerophosphoryl diester phosphodiesterase
MVFLLNLEVHSEMARGVLIEAHRGDSFRAPENTIASIQSAVGKAQLTEFDVRVTADGQWILMHDSTVNRTTNGSGAVAELTLPALKTLDAGSWFSAAFEGERIPTLEEAMMSAVAGGLQPLIERKDGPAQQFHDELERIGVDRSAFRVISFDWDFLTDLDAIETQYTLGALGSGPITQATITDATMRGADFLDWAHAGVDQAAVDLTHANGIELHVWTVDDPLRMQQLVQLGVDGITTNRPEVLQQVLFDQPTRADLDGDGSVNSTDWMLYHTGRGADLGGLSLGEAHRLGDMDQDGDNDIADFVRFKKLYLQFQPEMASEAARQVPEPTTQALMLVALLKLRTTHRSHAPPR